MNKYLSLIVLLMLTSCATHSPLVVTPEIKAKKVAIIGNVTNDISVLYQGTTVFENKLTTYNLDWDATRSVTTHIVTKLNEAGFNHVDDLTNDPQFGVNAKDTFVTTVSLSGGELNPQSAELLQLLTNKGYSYVIAVRDSNTFVSSERRIPAKGVFYGKGVRESSVYATIAATLIDLKSPPSLVGAVYEGCPKEFLRIDAAFEDFPTNIATEKDISKDEFSKLKGPLEKRLAVSADRQLCIYGLTKPN